VNKKVIDVSVHNGTIIWDQTKRDIDGAILRCGYGSNREDQDDKQYARNLKECERLGIPYGVYLYSYASTSGAIQSEIDHVLRLVRGHDPKLGVFIDLEENTNGEIASIVAEVFCRAINAAGYKA
jgi:GH25 family lysozyme M1 (1,4-beta-N-acetylmuramidase)